MSAPGCVFPKRPNKRADQNSCRRTRVARTNYTDNYCAALIKRGQQIRLLLLPNLGIRARAHTRRKGPRHRRGCRTIGQRRGTNRETRERDRGRRDHFPRVEAPGCPGEFILRLNRKLVNVSGLRCSAQSSSPRCDSSSLPLPLSLRFSL